MSPKSILGEVKGGPVLFGSRVVLSSLSITSKAAGREIGQLGSVVRRTVKKETHIVWNAAKAANVREEVKVPMLVVRFDNDTRASTIYPGELTLVPEGE